VGRKEAGRTCKRTGKERRSQKKNEKRQRKGEKGLKYISLRRFYPREKAHFVLVGPFRAPAA